MKKKRVNIVCGPIDRADDISSCHKRRPTATIKVASSKMEIERIIT